MAALKNIIATLAPALLFTACCATRHTADTVSDNRAADSVRVEVRERIVLVPDTVFVDIPRQTAERTTLADSSHLENDYAESDARINADGTLYHSLATKAQTKAVPTNKTVETKDSTAYRDRVVTQTRTVTKTVTVEKKLSWFQKTQIYGFWALIILFAIIYRRKIFQAVVRRIKNK